MNSTRLVALLLWIPFLLEATFIPAFTISIPGSPLSVGRICLLLLGIIGWNYRQQRLRPSSFRIVVYLLVFGSFIGTVFSQNIGRDVISYIGFSLLLVSTLGASHLMVFPEVVKILKFFFHGVFIYWVLYVFRITLAGGKLVTYGEIYRENMYSDDSLINYHAFGLVISASIVYMAEINGWLRKWSLTGIAYILIGVLAILITESRANLLITLFLLLLQYIANNRVKLSVAFRIGVIISIFAYLASLAMKQNDRLNRRFDVQDTEYITQTTESRFVFIALTFSELRELPFGGGVKNNRVNYFGTEYQPHNQYLTFILFAGIFGFIADLLWFLIFFRITRRVYKNKLDYYKPYLSTIAVVMLVLLTNDLSGAFFLLALIFQTWICREVIDQKINRSL